MFCWRLADSRSAYGLFNEAKVSKWGDMLVNPGYRLLAAKYVRKQAKQLRAQFEGICAAEDIEFVHRARVAARRLRAAMRILGKCFRRKRARRWQKAIRRIRSELGEARDKDVQIEVLRGILDSLGDKACFAGISRLLIQWEQERERLQSEVVKAVKRMEAQGHIERVGKRGQAHAFKGRRAGCPGRRPREFCSSPARGSGVLKPVVGAGGLSGPAGGSA